MPKYRIREDGLHTFWVEVLNLSTGQWQVIDDYQTYEAARKMVEVHKSYHREQDEMKKKQQQMVNIWEF